MRTRGMRPSRTGWEPVQRGEIRLVELAPVGGAEAARIRPAVIVSNDAANQAAVRLGRGVVTVVPVTGATDGCIRSRCCSRRRRRA